MDDKTRFCSACGRAMEFRLGQFECPGCGRVEAAQAPVAQPDSRRMPGGSTSSSSSGWDPGAQYRQPPPPQGMAPPPPLAGGYSGYSAGRPGYGAAPSGGDDPLRTEKYIYLGLQGLGVLVIALAFPALSKFMAATAPPAAGSGPDPAAMLSGVMGFVIVTAIMGLGLNALALFLREIWLKWTCLGCTGCSALMAVGGALVGMAAAHGGGGGLGAIMQLAVAGWLVSILYRDIQNIQTGY